MANNTEASKSKQSTAKKRDTQNAKHRLRNRSFKSKVKTAIRSFEKDVTEDNGESAKARLLLIYSLLDKGVKMGIYKLNKASRDKSRFSNWIK
jgi:small subunit ribosomal protein S20